MPEKLNFTKAALEGLVPGDTRRDVYDARQPGLILRITPAGSKSFAVYRRVQGVPKRIKLGSFPDMTVEQARRKARAELNTIAEGGDPVARKRAERARAVTLEEAFENYLKASDLKPRSIIDYRSALNTSFPDWLKKPLTSIDRDMVEHRFRKRSTESPSRANHAFRVLRAVLNHAAETLEDEDGGPLLTSNPVKRLSATRAWNRVDRRQTVIKRHQLVDWFAAVAALQGERSGSHAQMIRDYLVFLLLTGLRKLEAARLTWDRVDLVGAAFTVTDTKNREDHALPLSDYLLEMLERRRAAAPKDAKYVFATPRKPGYPVEVRWWTVKVSEASGVEFTLHDLRRTFATVAESLDLSGYSIKRLMNHKTGRADVTGGYIVADVERLRKPMQQITDYILAAAGVREGGEVISLKDRA